LDKQQQPMSLLQLRYRPQDAAMDNDLADDELLAQMMMLPQNAYPLQIAVQKYFSETIDKNRKNVINKSTFGHFSLSCQLRLPVSRRQAEVGLLEVYQLLEPDREGIRAGHVGRVHRKSRCS
jgi:hypothetical protein